jgi:hypothetical protein
MKLSMRASLSPALPVPEKSFALRTGLKSRVVRWFVFKHKIPIWVEFGGPWNRKFCYIL